jgi:2-methylisocitrate lyase-like PEP mutase family enzyme
LAAVSRAAQGRLFVNARTDVFLTSDHGEHAGLVSDAVERARAYADAGADGFFVPGLLDAGLVADVVAGSPLPVNVMVSTREQARALAQAGAARISLGPAAYLAAMEAVTADAGAWLAA